MVQQIEFLGRQVYGLAALLNQPASRIEPDIADADDRATAYRRSMRTADRGANARNQLADRKRLGDVIVGACFQSFYFVVLAVADGQHEHGDARELTPDFAAGLD